MDGAGFWILATLAAFCVGLSKGGAPAFSALAVPLLALTISPIAAAGLLLPVLLFSDVFGVWAYRRHVNWGLLRLAMFGIVAGTGIGWATAHLVSENFVRVVIGVIGFVFSLNFLARARHAAQPREADVAGGLFWVTVAGFTSFVSHAGAPPWQVWVLPQRLPKMVLAGTTTVVFAVMNVLKIVPYAMLGQFDGAVLSTATLLFAPAALGVFVAYRAIQILPERVFYAVVTWMLLAVSVKLIWDGLTG